MLKIGHEGCWISWPNRVWASWILSNEADAARLKMEVGIILANDSVKIPRPVKNGKINLWIRICYTVQGCRIYYIEWLPYSIVITKLLCSVRVWFWFSRKNIHMILKILIKQYIHRTRGPVNHKILSEALNTRSVIVLEISGCEPKTCIL